MAFGFESGITAFFKRRHRIFKEVDLEGSFAERIQDLKKRMKTLSNHQPTVVILGAGPAGLLRAIQSISNGNLTTVIEKRSQNAPGRINTVALTATTIQMLKYCGIYQYLIENQLIYPPNQEEYICVRLADLEQAMKEVLSQLSSDPIIQYDSKVAQIASQADKIELIIESVKDGQKTLSGIDIVVNAEGSRSCTNGLLNITRTEVLPRIPVIAAIYNDHRPKIRGIASLLNYIGKSMVYIARTIHYHMQFFFKLIASKSFREQITGSLILKTPGQNYIGCAFSDKVNRRLLALKKDVADQTNKGGTELKSAQEKYDTFAKYWINLSICHANMVAIRQRFFTGGPYLYTGGHFSLDNFEVIEIGADRANACCQRIGNAVVLLAGDANATVDPTTGLGCNTAFQSSVDFLDFIWDYDVQVSREQLLQDYKTKTQERVTYSRLN